VQPLLGLLRALDRAGVRVVVVGGVAVVLQGHARLTADLDLVVDLAPDNVRATLAVLTEQGLAPRLPVPVAQFADADTRLRWVRERNLTVFSLHDPTDPRRAVDLFAEPPLPFEELWAAADVLRIDDVTVRVASVDHLIAMKELAGRAQDLADIEALRSLRDHRRPDEQ
jgi:hypothetical protein